MDQIQPIAVPGLKPGRRCAAALLVTETGRYLMQHRDDFAWIDFPDHWASFGGVVEAGETPETTVRRELIEEIDYAAPSVSLFTEFQVIMPFAKPRLEWVSFFAVPIAEAAVPELVLGEGAGLALFRAEELAVQEKVAPWDLAAVLMHARRAQLFRPKTPRPQS